MNAWWRARQRSEQILVAAGIAILLLCAWYLALVEPLGIAHERGTVRLRAATATHREISRLAAQARQLAEPGRTGTPFSTTRPLLSVVNQSGSRAGTQAYTRRVNPVGEDGVALVLDDVPFTDLAGWLVALDRQHGVAVERASIERAAAGLADARITLRARRAD